MELINFHGTYACCIMIFVLGLAALSYWEVCKLQAIEGTPISVFQQITIDWNTTPFTSLHVKNDYFCDSGYE